MATTLKLKATDTLFFGSGRPFTMGEDSWSTGIFPPYPETFTGFLRACYFLDDMTKLALAETLDDESMKLIIESYGLLLEKDGITERLFPLPLDLVFNKTRNTVEKLRIKKNDPSIISNGLEELSCKLIYEGLDKVRSSDSGHYLRETDFHKYLKGSQNNFKPIDIKEYISGEPKIGIKRNRFDNTDKELYRLNMNRLETEKSELSFWITFDKLSFNTKINRLGGEGKLVFNQEIEKWSTIENNREFKVGDIVRLYCSTPAIYENGWKTKIDGAELLTAVLGKPIHIGGFDLHNKRPKPTQKAVPAGSVYYYRITENTTLPHKLGMFTEKGYGNIYYTKFNNL